MASVHPRSPRLPLLACVAVLNLVTVAFPGDVDRSSLSGKVVCGYQGWFRCPGDGSPPGTTWTHWGRGGAELGPGLYTVDMWPDVSECDPDELFTAPNVTLTNGETGQLFSSVSRKTVERHFRWMRDAGIDGVFLQRFIGPTASVPDIFTSNNMVLENVRQGANLYGRGFAVEYDCSGDNEATLYNNLVNDWQYLCDVLDVRNDPAYWHHDGQPVVIIWGLGFTSRPFSASVAAQVVDFFQNDPVYGGNYCIGGVPTGWRTLNNDSFSEPEWANVYRGWDAICPWTVGRYHNPSGVEAHKLNRWLPDLQECNSVGRDYMPVIWPGFSWDNLQQYPPGHSVIPRLDGEFLWSQVHAVADIGVDMLFVAMFDEVDEGTAIFKVSDDHPVTDHWKTYEGLPHDWYMRLTGAASGTLSGRVPLSVDFPIDPHCNGVEAFAELSDDTAASLSLVTVADGDTAPATIGGRGCRTNVTPGDDRYMYFAIDDAFAAAGSDPEICVYVDYFDTGTPLMVVQYDALDGSHYKNTDAHRLTNTQQWKRRVFQIPDALLSNGQNNGADLRVAFSGDDTKFYIGRFTVGTPRPAAAGMAVNAATAGCIVGQHIPIQTGVFTVRNTGVAPLNFAVTSDMPWLTPIPAAGTSTGESDPIAMQIDTSSLSIGVYTATVTVTDTDGVLPAKQVEVVVRVLPSRHVSVDLGGATAQDNGVDVENGLKRPNYEPADGNTTGIQASGRFCRRTLNAAGGDLYMYFDVSSAFASGGFVNPALVTIEYLDNAYGTLALQYDGYSSPYSGGGSVYLSGTNEWRSHTFEVHDAYFQGRQNGNSDFRILRPEGTMYLDVVQVDTLDLADCELIAVPEAITRVFGVGTATASDAIAFYGGSSNDPMCTVTSDAAWLTLSTPVIPANNTDSVVIRYAVSELEIGEHVAHVTLSNAACPGGDATVTVVVRILSAVAMRLDVDEDGDIDADDMQILEPCLAGPGVDLTGGPCEFAADVDGDADFDLADWARVQQCAAGAGGLVLCE